MILDKALLRTEMKKIRNSFSDKNESNKRIAEAFLSSDIYKSAKQLLLYASVYSEADTEMIFERAVSDGKDVFFPYCVPKTNWIRFYRVNSLSELIQDAYLIPAPRTREANEWHPKNNAVCVVPGLAFTASGKRLGYGKGYYDTFLEKNDVRTVGLCYSFQVLSDIPTEAHDRLMDYICTEKGLIPCSFYGHGGKDEAYER